MPGFSTWGDQSQRIQPLTPPDHDTAYSNRLSDAGYYQQSNPQYRNSRLDHGFGKQYQHVPSYNAQAFNNRTSAQMTMTTGHDMTQVAPYSQFSSHRTYAPEATVPTLPPIRSHDVMDPYGHYMPANVQVPVEQKPKEEKATGGVAAHLDYDMSTMTDFVAEMSQGMYAIYQSGICLSDIDFMRSVNSNTHVGSQYRKYVSQILSSTRLPSSTIMLGLFYLANRMKILSARGDDTGSSSSVYRMLTTCLLLGSKFLDDNTFQNRSWAEVSSIPVKELNQMELDWLIDFEWSMHGRMYDRNEGFFMWREHWLAYEEETTAKKMKDVHKLAPIDTDPRRQRSVQRPMMSPEGPIPAQYQRNSQYDTQWVSPLISEPSPPSAAYSGPATPEYYNNSTWTYGHPSTYSNQLWSSTNSTPLYASSRSQQPFGQTSNYMQQYPATMWHSSGHGCGCSVYGKCKDHYFLQPGHYGMQTVAC